MDASVDAAGSSEGTVAASDGLETFQVGSQDMWERFDGGEGIRRSLYAMYIHTEMLSDNDNRVT